MSIIVIAVASESGVPIFSRKRGNNESIQFSTIASLHGINMFTKCHNLSLINTQLDNGTIIWKEYCKSVTLIGIATGGLECDLENLLACIHDVMIFCIGKKELENLKNIDQIKRDLRQCYQIIDYLLESLDPNSLPQSTIILDYVQSLLCPQAQPLQQVLDNYAQTVTGRWACLSIHGHLVATSSDFCELDAREAKLLLLLAAAQEGAPLRETLKFVTAIINERGDVHVVPLRFLALFFGGLFSLFMSSLIGWSGAGPLAIVSSGFIAAYYWEKQGWVVNKNPVSNLFRILWIFFEPILFAFTGAQITISALDPQVISMGALCLVSCLLIRVVATFFISSGCGLNSKEKLFIGLTWMAKATVQAALGPAALDLVNNGKNAGGTRLEEETYAKTILAVSVLSVVISAPLGAVLIAVSGPRLLSCETKNTTVNQTENTLENNTAL